MCLDKCKRIPQEYSFLTQPPPSLLLPLYSFLFILQATMAEVAPPPPAVAPASSSGPTILTQPPPPTNQRESRIATHSHIKGLGLADDGTAMEHSQGFVGQRQAREALGLHLSLLKMGRHSGRPLLLVGPPGTGKVSCFPLSPSGRVLARHSMTGPHR